MLGPEPVIKLAAYSTVGAAVVGTVTFGATPQVPAGSGCAMAAKPGTADMFIPGMLVPDMEEPDAVVVVVVVGMVTTCGFDGVKSQMADPARSTSTMA